MSIQLLLNLNSRPSAHVSYASRPATRGNSPRKAANRHGREDQCELQAHSDLQHPLFARNRALTESFLPQCVHDSLAHQPAEKALQGEEQGQASREVGSDCVRECGSHHAAAQTHQSSKRHLRQQTGIRAAVQEEVEAEEDR